MNILAISLTAFLSKTILLSYLSFYFKKNSIQLVTEMGLGYNLGNTFNFSIFKEENNQNNQIKIRDNIFPTKETLKKIKKYGFKTIRFQLDYNNLVNQDEELSIELISGIKEVVDYILNYNMYFILSIHHNRQFWMNEGKNAKEKYSIFWKQIANKFLNYDEHLVFESMNELYFVHFTLLNSTQAFVDAIRNSGGFNKERLLVISEISNEIELNDYYEYELPIDPANKLAISLHYYFPSESLDIYDTTPMSWYDKYNFPYKSIPKTEWGIDNDYKELMEKIKILENIFINKGIPVIIGEASILVKSKNNNNSIRQFLYSLFSISLEIGGILPCLWDIPEKISDNMYYYDKDTDKWNDEKIRDILLNISRGKTIKSSEYYSMTNLENIIPNYNYGFFNFGKKKIVKIIINAKISGQIGKDFEFGISSVKKNKDWFDLPIKKENGKKQYNGYTIFTIDTSYEDFNNFLYISVWWGEDDNYITINNITFEFQEEYLYFDYKSYKSAVLNVIN